MYSQKDEEEYIIDYFKNRSAGKFLDFGAFEPFTFSNTRKLYEMGWKGIYIEPSRSKFEMFVREYIDDHEMVIINKAVSTYDGKIKFYNCNDGVSTTDVKHMEKWKLELNIENWNEEIIPCISINTLLKEYARKIDFLNIDVEGTNFELLKAINHGHLRGIKMICIEHDNHFLEMIEILAKHGFKLIHINDENLIVTRGSIWTSVNLKLSRQTLNNNARYSSSMNKRKRRIPLLNYIKEQFKIYIREELKRQYSVVVESDMGFIKRNSICIRNLDYLYDALQWKCKPNFNREQYSGCDDPMNVNGRRVHDMEVVLGACKNLRDPKGTILEIGTAYGNMTMNMSKNAPEADIYTINIPEEEIEDGGEHITFAIPNDQIGQIYRDANCHNITQILANTLEWEPQMERIDIAFIDGCHDADFIYQDTIKVLSKCQPGSIIIWHDFNPDLVDKWGWIGDVCKGVNRLYQEGILTKKMYHLQDSWTGVYRV